MTASGHHTGRPAHRAARTVHRSTRLATLLGCLTSVLLLTLSGVLAGSGPAGATINGKLIRYPYLTDLTSSSVQVTFDTTVKITSANGAVRWGSPSGSTGCTLTGSSASASTNTVNAPITVAGVTEYQNSITVSGLSAGTSYCYRVYTGGSSPVDLLGTDAAPRFSTMSATTSLTFDVFGDWGDTSVSGGSGQAALDKLIAASGAKFAVSTGDIAYPNGTQTNYGNLVATGSATSEVFGPSFWKVPGAQIPLFSVTGNHGRTATYLQNWRQPTTAAASGGMYAMQTYSGIDGTTSASYPSNWYAFSTAGARFYLLTADWADNNTGTAASPYQVDRDYHWQTSSAEYAWLKADLAAHPGGLKFAFFHFPLRSDDATEPSDTYLQSDPNHPTATSTLEGLLRNNGVNLVFNGHAHIYQRSVAPPGGITSYVTGGGGAALVPVDKSNCSPTTAYAIGWGYTNSSGSKCGSAPVPSSAGQVYHFLKVSVSGRTVTVTPVNSAGSAFDPMTYNFAADSTAPAAPTNLLAVASGTSVALSWTASTSGDASATDIYRNGSYLATVPAGVLNYADKAPLAGASYTVRAHDLAGNQSGDSASASVGSASDTTPPTTPTGLTATATSATSVQLTWSASYDNVGVTGYRLYRGGAPLTSVAGSVLSYVDNAVRGSTSYSYTLQAVDAAGNVSPMSGAATATTPAGGSSTATVFHATDDATIDATNPTLNAGSSLHLTADGNPVDDFLVRFSVSAPAGCTFSHAVLQLTVGTAVNNNSVSGGNV
ncbi:MAG TPA: fibronectin type III domain-containing protein, partial [Jatrophihabitans sp.]|nr:fibronectin type III domain-containing protein [Jatrophihabitans sp.]